MRVPESRDRTSPIGPVLKLFPFLCGDRLPIGDEPWAGGAVGDAIVEEGQRTHSWRSLARNLKVDHACRSLVRLIAYVLNFGSFTVCRRQD
jgi:hypothetical protein